MGSPTEGCLLRHRRAACPGLLALAFWFPLLLAAGASDDWPRYAHDPALTARSPLKGAITQPRVGWSSSLAGRELRIDILPAHGERHLDLNPNDPSAATAVRVVKPPAPRLLDLDGTGMLRPLRETYHERWAKILPEARGWQRVAWSHTWTDQKVCRLQLFAYDNGFDPPRMVWQTDPRKTPYSSRSISFTTWMAMELRKFAWRRTTAS